MAVKRAHAAAARIGGASPWQVTLRVLTEALAIGGEEARRAFGAMMDMTKIDVAAIQAARRPP